MESLYGFQSLFENTTIDCHAKLTNKWDGIGLIQQQINPQTPQWDTHTVYQAVTFLQPLII